MDLCSDQLLAHLPAAGSGSELVATDLEAPFQRRFQKLPIVGKRRAAFNADRLLNRHLVLPRFLRRHAADYDFFHVVDHSYAHVVSALPPDRVGVYCHDLDAFGSLLDPIRDPRPWWFRRLAARTLRGLRAAAVVFHNSREVGRQLVEAGLVAAEKLVHAPLGVAAEFTPGGAPIEFPVPEVTTGPFLLHVGSHIPRKRIDVLLDVFALVQKSVPGVRLVQVGGPWAPALAGRIDRLGIRPAVAQVSGLSRQQLAELYRKAAAVLVPSEAEGFGLPVIESLACGAVVIASDIPVLREVGGDAVVYCPVADVSAWAGAVTRVLADPALAPPRETRLIRASRYSWAEHARVIAETYLGLERAARTVPARHEW
jgi:glycosyltransferase involved in cell wall biosynthesis